MQPSPVFGVITLWIAEKAKDRVVCRMVALTEHPQSLEIRLSFNGFCILSRCFADPTEAGVEAHFLLSDFTSRGWEISPHSTPHTVH